MDIKVFYIFIIYLLFVLLFSKNLANTAYIFPISQETIIRLEIPKTIVIADIPASFGP